MDKVICKIEKNAMIDELSIVIKDIKNDDLGLAIDRLEEIISVVSRIEPCNGDKGWPKIS
jgi:hypothetical protein